MSVLQEDAPESFGALVDCCWVHTIPGTSEHHYSAHSPCQGNNRWANCLHQFPACVPQALSYLPHVFGTQEIRKFFFLPCQLQRHLNVHKLRGQSLPEWPAMTSLHHQWLERFHAALLHCITHKREREFGHSKGLLWVLTTPWSRVSATFIKVSFMAFICLFEQIEGSTRLSAPSVRSTVYWSRFQW